MKLNIVKERKTSCGCEARYAERNTVNDTSDAAATEKSFFNIQYSILNIKSRCGFTLIEALIAMLLLGFAITGLIVANQTFTKANGAGLELSTAEFLIEQIREQTVTMKFSDLVGTFNATPKSYYPSAYPDYKQVVTGQYLQSTDFTQSWSSGPKVFYKITVEVDLNNKPISSASWLRANY